MRKTLSTGAVPGGKNWCSGWLEGDYYKVARTDTMVRESPAKHSTNPSKSGICTSPGEAQQETEHALKEGDHKALSLERVQGTGCPFLHLQSYCVNEEMT